MRGVIEQKLLQCTKKVNFFFVSEWKNRHWCASFQSNVPASLDSDAKVTSLGVIESDSESFLEVINVISKKNNNKICPSFFFFFFPPQSSHLQIPAWWTALQHHWLHGGGLYHSASFPSALHFTYCTNWSIYESVTDQGPSMFMFQLSWSVKGILQCWFTASEH